MNTKDTNVVMNKGNGLTVSTSILPKEKNLNTSRILSQNHLTIPAPDTRDKHASAKNIKNIPG